MSFLTQSDLEPVIEGDKRTRELFYDEFAQLVATMAGTVNHKLVVSRSREDVEMELWEFILGDSCKLLRKYGGQAPFPHYLASCLKRRCIDFMRKVNSESDHRAGSSSDAISHDSWLERMQNDMAADAEQDEESRQEFEHTMAGRSALLGKALERLDPESRLFLKMLVLDECEPEIVMKAFNIESRTTVYTKRHRLIEKLRALMTEENTNAADAAPESGRNQ